MRGLLLDLVVDIRKRTRSCVVHPETMPGLKTSLPSCTSLFSIKRCITFLKWVMAINRGHSDFDGVSGSFVEWLNHKSLYSTRSQPLLRDSLGSEMFEGCQRFRQTVEPAQRSKDYFEVLNLHRLYSERPREL